MKNSPRGTFFLVKFPEKNSMAENSTDVNFFRENSHGENSLVFISRLFSANFKGKTITLIKSIQKPTMETKSRLKYEPRYGSKYEPPYI